MDDFYTNYIVKEYNAKFQKNILFACPCYHRYTDFVDCIFKQRRSYFCCIIINIDKDTTKVVHDCFPVMLGSEIDFAIRSMERSECDMYGALIIKGTYQIMPNFITNNLGTGHVYKTRSRGKKVLSSKTYVINLERDRVMLQVKYDPNATDSNTISVAIVDQVYAANEIAKRKRAATDERLADLKEPVKKKKNKHPGKTEFHDRSRNITWIDMVNGASPIKNSSFSEKDYTKYFDSCIRCAPDLDHLANKTLVSPSTLLERVIVHIVKLCRKTSEAKLDAGKIAALSTKLKNVFSSGNMYFALSSKNAAKVMKEFKCVYQPVDGQKIHLISKTTSLVKRYVSDQARNSKALKYPEDAFGYIDPINVREMKGAGETIFLSQLVVASPEIDDDSVMEILNKNSSEKSGELTVVWNGFLTNYKLKKTALLNLKIKCPFLSLMIFDEYLNVNSKGHVLMKYSIKYDCFITPHEARNLFLDAFENYEAHLNFSSLAMMLPKSIIRAQPAKCVVALSNVKGRCQTLNSKLSVMSFLYTIGTSNAALIHAVNEDVGGDDDEIIKTTLHDKTSKPLTIPVNLTRDACKRYAKLAESRGCEMPQILKKLFSTFKPISDNSEQNALSYKDIINDCDVVIKKIDEIVDKWLNNKYMLYVACQLFKEFEPSIWKILDLNAYHRLTRATAVSSSTKAIELYSKMPIRFASKEKLLEKYNPFIKLDTESRTTGHVLLYCAFGDIDGGTNEDGIILDSQFVEKGPSKLISITLSVKFSEKSNVHQKSVIINDEVCKVSYTPINKHFSPFIVVGILCSRQPLTTLKSKNVVVIESVINTHYRYVVLYTEYSDTSKEVESFYYPQNSTLTMHFRYTIKLGVGTKIANVHGQKGVCSIVTDLKTKSIRDLSKHIGFRADGVRVHPQILFSTTSIVGRTVASQISEMINSNVVGFTVYGEPIALLSFNIHHIEPSVKGRPCIVKNDLMTSENGFIANGMTNLAQCLADQGPSYQRDLMHLITQLNILNGVRLQFIDFDPLMVEDLDVDSSDSDNEERHILREVEVKREPKRNGKRKRTSQRPSSIGPWPAKKIAYVKKRTASKRPSQQLPSLKASSSAKIIANVKKLTPRKRPGQHLSSPKASSPAKKELMPKNTCLQLTTTNKN